MKNTEALGKANINLDMALSNLREAYGKSSQVAGLEIYRLIGEVAETWNRSKALLQAIEADTSAGEV